ncbi:MAG: TIGR02584 family CRISPR-associated protein [Magnetococcales bacterium]|nr:TIGR02584 family CRISPR-associated protein [Magnetococcales bacterium]
MSSGKPSSCHLIVVTGLTPQVITEALYALQIQEGCSVQRISVLTTPEGSEAVQNALMLTRESPLERFCHDYGIARRSILFDQQSVYRIWPSRSVESSLEPASLDHLMTWLAKWCALDKPPVVACVAGGRKDMAVLFAQIFSLLARKEDRLVHLLIPPIFENLAEFFYPPPQPATLTVHRAGGVIFLNSTDAHVELMEIPLIRLRSLVDEETLTGVIPLTIAQQRVQHKLDDMDLTVRLVVSSRAVLHRGHEEILPPKEFSLLLFFARARLQGWGEGGWIAGIRLDDPYLLSNLEQAYQEVTSGNLFGSGESWATKDRNGKIVFEELKVKVVHAISKIKNRLGSTHPGRVQSRKGRGGQQYGLMLDSDQIVIEEG